MVFAMQQAVCFLGESVAILGYVLRDYREKSNIKQNMASTGAT